MGYPIRKLSDILNNQVEIRQLQADFYTFILYKHEHTEFRNFILQHFNRLHEISGSSGAILFILDFPDEWMRRNDIDYYHNIQGRGYQPALNDEEVDVVCKYFKVHPDSLPAVIVFKDFQSQGCTNVSLKDAKDSKDLLNFFRSLYSYDQNGLIGWGRDYGTGSNLYIKDRMATYQFPFVQTQSTTFSRDENISTVLSVLYKKMEDVQSQLNRIENKVDRILEVMQVLQYDIETIKSTRRSEEQKLKLIYAKIDQKLKGLKESLKEDIQVYEELLKDFIEHWDKLDDLSKEMLPLADYLFDKLSRLQDADYSPVILQYCRSLENELLKKLFVQFTLHICKKSNDLDRFLQVDLQHEKTSHFAKSIQKYKNKEPKDIKYTLGEMGRVLDLTAGRKTILESPLLQEFKLYIGENFDESIILSKEYRSKIKAATEEFRNKCAHPYKLNEEQALQCKEAVPDDINSFLKNWKHGISI